MNGAFERVLAALGLIVIAPVLMVAAVLMLIESGRPLLFRQERVGRAGSRFLLFKLRSMYPAQPGPQITAAADARITPFGKVLRRYKVDELPQLWNVLRGDMNLIGPRPEVPAYVNSADPLWRYVLSFKPGITDLASLLYRNEEALIPPGIDADQFYRKELLPRKLALTCHYLRTRSRLRDLRLILTTVWFSMRPSRFDAARIASRFGIPFES